LNGERAVIGDAEITAEIEMIGQDFGGAVQREIGELGVALIGVGKEDPLAISGPSGRGGVAIEFGSNDMGIRAIAIGDLEEGGLVALEAIIEADVGDEFAVGRNVWGLLGAIAVRELAQGAIGDIKFEEFGVQRLVLIIGGAIHGKDKRLSVGGPGGVRTPKIAHAGAMGKFAAGELARSPTIGSNNENLRIAGFKIAGTVEAID